MTTTEIAQRKSAIAPPLRILIPLIKDDLRQGDEASKKAGKPYYRAAGQKLLQARPQVAHGDWAPWLKRHFSLSTAHARRYMEYADATSDIDLRRIDPNDLPDFSEVMRERVDPSYGKVVRKQAWHEPVSDIVTKARANAARLQEEELNRAQEREAQRKLALQVIDIGYKVLAAKLHPDKGGSRDAMARLNKVRDRLKASA